MNTLKFQFKKDITQADLLIIPIDIKQDLSPLVRQIDAVIGGGVKNFSGKKGEVIEYTTNGNHYIPRIILVGLGDSSQLKPVDIQELGGNLFSCLKGNKIAFEVPVSWVADLAFGLKLRAWKFSKYFTQNIPEDKEITFLNEDPETSLKLFAAKDFIYEGVELARELTVEPANHLYPDAFVKRCLNLQELGVHVEVFDEAALEKMGAQGILNVGKSSINPPRMVVMHWKGGDVDQAPIALAGKGVCYDCGGINIKTKELLEMKFDKAGAAVVTGVIHALASQKAPVNVVGVIGLAENMIDGASMKPGDIITTLSGKTVEVVDTDYEGRLILADCLWYAQERFHPSFVIDLGTLTPETIAPLADQYAGLYSEDAKLVASLIDSGMRSGEKVWHLPMGPLYAKQLESEYADIKNMGIPWFGEGAAAAEFLKCFIKPEIRWAHMDIAGVAWTLEDRPLNAKGITGYGVRLLLDWIQG
jgi:leucyl aminopeptidase